MGARAYFEYGGRRVYVEGRAVYSLEEAAAEARRGRAVVGVFAFDAVSPWDDGFRPPPRPGWPTYLFVVGEEGEPPAWGGDYGARLVYEEPRDLFERRVAEAKRALEAGEVFQLVVARFRRYRFAGSPEALFNAVRKTVGGKYYYFVEVDGLFLVGASPETLVSCWGGRAVSGPIGGTRPRGRTPEEDAALEAELRESVKDKAEHIMLVDSVRNDLGRVCRWGTVSVSSMLAVEKYSHYQHLVSYVECQLDKFYRPVDAVRALNPTTTVSGVPKPRALELLSQLEEPRGPFAGSVGVIARDGVEFAVVIRSVYGIDGDLYLWAGAGIVTDSKPHAEWEETEVKMAPLAKLLT
ncbi:anthranilate synthase component I family protein [Pyrobaculum neutrophilum]|uniref:anthranilate synthase n=1 Tax=Pyrobaculum neutrophilum (strain DSM 2338 / JCM 9278 / NBRC 100436 / V24Sta) TaxID=444157 RepID=B1YBG0_PYRNV|nr:anthranilate synthase component I family protein [Pyrobaculum neutrophilum]ACB40762.1 Anthranilate synthase [Pyrobaculum neutrophilum V24Sta]